MILGEMKMESTRFGMDSACKAYQDIPLSELLHNAVQNIQGEIPEYVGEIDEISDEQDEVIPADPNVRNFSYTLVNGQIYFRENDRMTPATLSMTAANRIKGLIEIRDCVRKLIEYQTEDYPEEMIQTEQENLNRLYDAFAKSTGLSTAEEIILPLLQTRATSFYVLWRCLTMRATSSEKRICLRNGR